MHPQEETQKVPVAENKREILEQVSQEYLRILVSLYKKKQLVISCIREEGGLEAKRGWQRLYENLGKSRPSMKGFLAFFRNGL